ncbi:alpha/beta hydrolase family protein [Haloactinopolyspora alba]|uniref:Alpha/beta hydrolase family protein n=1 Tax=Haloactinopolyspora alba TaxID=648780 RepID=A0A2P8E9J2_9ACTN|nr:alpha/beta fold hydrolase [Haloactinopolyspora alba]PSL06087.1 alpha/beta hydrolase family protein [Haloactinopolyspora alba]
MSVPTPVTEDAGIPTTTPTPIVSYLPVTLNVPGRHVDLQVKVTMPATGDDLPILLFSHGHGPSTFVSSFNGYGPLTNFWAARGFVVVQPTHQDSLALGLRGLDDPDAPLYSVSRADDMVFILDHLDDIEAAVPGLAGRTDRTRIAAVGHSLGGHTVSMLRGAEMEHPATQEVVSFNDDRIAVGVDIAGPGDGRELAEFADTNYPALRSLRFDAMTAAMMVVVGENDQNPMFSDNARWREQPYDLGPSPKTRLYVYGAEHGFGGISMWDGAETTDENPERVAAVRSLIWAFLRSSLYPGDPAWDRARAALESSTTPPAAVTSK